MKKIYLLIVIILFILPVNVFADSIEKFLTDISINADGSISVKEIITLDGKYNGLVREIIYKNTNAMTFNGQKESFNGSDIYNGSNITNLKIYDVDNGSNFVNLKLSKEYSLTTNASNGDYGVFTKEHTTNGFNLKVFNSSSNNNSFYIEYTVNDVIINHQDISEIGWNLFNNNNKEDINYYEATIHLPESDKSMRIWGHGPLDGDVKRVDDKTVIITYDKLLAGHAVDFRMTFKNGMVESSKKTDVVANSYIMEIEKERADEANNLREKYKTERNASIFFTVAWIILVITNLIYIYIKYDKEYSKTFFNEYYREIPEDLDVSELEYLMDKQVSEKSFSATILELVRKRVLIVSELEKKDYLLKYDITKEKLLNEEEKIVIDLLINDIGNKEEVSLKTIKQYGKKLDNANNFTTKYNNWHNNSMKKALKKDYYLDNSSIKIKSTLLSLLGFILLFFDINTNNGMLTPIIILVAIISIIYSVTFTKRSKEGNLAHQKWMAFKKFLKDFSRFKEKELPEVILWEKLLVYGSVLGVADTLEKDMKIKVQEFSNVSNTNVYMPNYFFNMYLYNSIHNTVSTVSSTSKTAILNSTNSSGSGFGGGMSMGGGSFGGGGSVGRF